MNVQARALLVALASISMMSPTTTLCQDAKELGREYLRTLKVGQWIRLEGTVQKDHLVLCSEAKLLTGDFLDDDWSVRGVVGSVEPRKPGFVIGPYSIVLSKKAVFENSDGTLTRFSDLRIGMFVEVEGSYRKDRTFLADGVDESNDVARRSEKYLRIVAKVERVDVARRQITAMGTVFQVVDRTRLKSVLR